jgi:hypothetical protein
MTSICLWSFKWSHLIINTEKYHYLLDKYPSTDDGFIHVVWWIVKNSEWEIYLHHSTRLNEFRIPWGKVDIWETYEVAMMRELKEELDIVVLDQEYISSYKYIIWWIKRCFHLFLIHSYTWIPQNNDSHKYDQYRAKIIDSDNEVGFSINIDGTITDDVQDIMQSFNNLYYAYVIAPQLGSEILSLCTYRQYDESVIDLAKHYYLYLDQEKKEYYFEGL